MEPLATIPARSGAAPFRWRVRGSRRRSGLLGLAFALMAGALLLADTPPGPEISAGVATELETLRTLVDGKDYAAALTLTGRLLATARPGSFDAFVLTEVRARIFLHQGNLAAAGPALEAALQTGIDGRFIAPAARLELLLLLAETRYQQAMADPGKNETRQAVLDRALDCYRQWKTGPGPATTDTAFLGASILYQRAVAGGAATPPDRALLRAAVAEAEHGLTLSVRLAENLLVLKVVALQQLGEASAATDQLELLVALQPDNPGYWRQLSALYLEAAEATTDAGENRRLNHRALLTFNRARTRGLMTGPRATFTLACLDFNLHQFSAATELLDTLRDSADVPEAELDRLKRALGDRPP